MFLLYHITDKMLIYQYCKNLHFFIVVVAIFDLCSSSFEFEGKNLTLSGPTYYAQSISLCS